MMTDKLLQTMKLKNISCVSVLNYVRRNHYTTKAELAAASGLTFMAIQKIMEELMGLGLVRPDNMRSGHVGRRAVTYTIDENYGYTAGLHINMFKTTVAVMNLHGEIVASNELDISHLPPHADALLQIFISSLKETIAQSGIDPQKLLGLGIGSPGPVNPNDGMILSPPNLSALRYMPIVQIMQEELKLRAYLCKDTNAIALGEYWRGAGAGYSSMVYIDADMGIGSGLILMGELQQGSHFAAGEFGHITIDPLGPLCNCGNYGCLEAMSSGISILKAARTQLAEKPNHVLYSKLNDLTLRDFLEVGSRGDSTAVTILNQAAYHMGNAISTLIKILDPQLIILGGALILEYEPFLSIIRDTVWSKKIAGMRETPIVRTKCEQKAGVIGSGELVADIFFSHLVAEVL